MPFSPKRFAEKLIDLLETRGSSRFDAAAVTGIPVARLTDLAAGEASPTGDEVLIISAAFLCDFQWLIEDREQNPDENLQILFRSEGSSLDTGDRQAIAEFLFLCKSQALLDELLGTPRAHGPFSFTPTGSYSIGQGRDCARALRQWHKLPKNAVIPDVFGWLRGTGLRVFRRNLMNSSISGLFVEHPDAGRCILVNAVEDPYRQRFSVAHEAGHALLDKDETYNLSVTDFSGDDQTGTDRREMRANAFASSFLMPPELLASFGDSREWRDPKKVVDVADKLWVTVPALLSALKLAKLIDESTRSELREKRLKPPERRDPELSLNLSPGQFERKRALLNAGLHQEYVSQCITAHRRRLLSLGKVAEMLLVHSADVADVAGLFGESLSDE